MGKRGLFAQHHRQIVTGEERGALHDHRRPAYSLI